MPPRQPHQGPLLCVRRGAEGVLAHGRRRLVRVSTLHLHILRWEMKDELTDELRVSIDTTPRPTSLPPSVPSVAPLPRSASRARKRNLFSTTSTSSSRASPASSLLAEIAPISYQPAQNAYLHALARYTGVLESRSTASALNTSKAKKIHPMSRARRPRAAARAAPAAARGHGGARAPRPRPRPLVLLK